MDPTDEDEALIEQVIHDTLDRIEDVSDEERAILAETIRGDLLYTEEGRALLRRARTEPHRDRSGGRLSRDAIDGPSAREAATSKNGGRRGT